MAPKALTDCPENLRESIDWLVQVKHGGGISKLSSALGKLFDHVAQDAQTSLSSPSESDDPSAGDVISKLQGFRSSLPQNSANTNENILHNLCSSFETFLGYKPPGTYDGSGIVYGSASRLCDAILAFLYAVFHDVYENQPYVSGRSILHDVLDKHLKPQLRQGHKGFTHAIPKVADGLRKYNEAVSASNEKVKKPINELLSYVGEGGKLLTEVNKIQVPEESTPLKPEEAVKAAEALVKECVDENKKLQHKFEATKRGNIVAEYNDLNLSLREKVRNARKNIGHEVRRLKQLSKRERQNLEAFIKMIRKALTKLKTDVNNQITKKVEELVKQLKDKVNQILQALEGISKSLGQYIMDLDKWIEKTKLDIDAAQKLVQKILNEVNGIEPAKCKNELDKAIETVETRLQERVADLTEWKEAAHKVLEGTILSSGNVYKDLDPNQQKDSPGETTKIGEGLQQITTAKTAVEGVNTGLIQVKNDLTAWNLAAKDVLSNVVSKATDVHKKLDPEAADTDHKIGTNIKAIEEAKTQLDNANVQLGQQVKALGTWITEAENIRAAAEKKAKEAYDKLKVNETLSNKIGEIVTANNKIKDVHGKLDTHLGSLNTWKQTATGVLTGAIQRANEVYDELNYEDKQTGGKTDLGQQIQNIDDAKKQIQNANGLLKTEVENLGKWKSAADKVIGNADKKCEEILGKVDKDKKSVIYSQAQELEKQGKKLLEAAKDAKQAVEQNVQSALEAVVDMDKNLKRDLKGVKQKIKKGIKDVIEQLQVNILDQKVRDDLEKLRGRISGLKTEVDKSNGEGLVKNELDALQSHKTTNLDTVVSQIQSETNTNLEKNFKQHIQSPLQSAVGAVDSAIVALGGNFNKLTRIESIFGHIKKQVGEIKGTSGDGSWENKNGQGLDGIKSKVHNYATAFRNDNFENIVKGWLEATILEYNGTVRRILGWTYGQDMKESIKQFGIGMKENFKVDAEDSAKAAFQNVDTASGSITKSIEAVQQLCNGFAGGLDKKLLQQGNDAVNHVKDDALQKGSLDAKITNCICECVNCKKPDCGKKAAAELIMCALTSTVRQVGNELNSVLLEPKDTNIATFLDTITPIATQLNEQLMKATQNSTPPTPDAGTAQAVDSRLQAVREFVDGSGENITSKFNKEVKGPLQQAVDQLPTAVSTFNQEAQDQIKAAAKTAIKEAACQIKTDSDGKAQLGADLMNEFNTQFTKITDTNTGLQKQLEQQVDTHIGQDDGPAGGGQGGTITDLAGGSFTEYSGHVNQESVKKYVPSKNADSLTGSLPLAIGKIRDDGLDALKIIDQKTSGQDQITDSTFTVPFTAITSQLDEIKKLVENKQGTPTGTKPDGVKDYLDELKSALDQGKLNGADKGLDAIKKAIDDLQKGTFDQQPEAIGQAVKAIRQQLKQLREKLQAKNGQPGNDVIKTLEDLQGNGLSDKDDWQNGKGKTLSGLGKIHKDLEEQNDTLKTRGDEITSAISQIKWALRGLGFKFQHVYDSDDILDKLKELESMIGQKAAIDGNLHHICYEIEKLQKKEFSQKPQAIGDAKQEIVDELTTLRTELQGQKDNDVIATLKDLQTNGLSGNGWTPKNSNNKKGLAKIHTELQDQQSELSGQPKNIQDGVNQITEELIKLQTQLNTEVTDKLKKLRDHGLTDGKEAWTIESKPDKGLTKITTDIVAIKTKDVKDVKDCLRALCAAIRMLAKDAEWSLNELKDGKIGEQLKQIRDEIDKLHGRLVDGPIKDLRAFLRFLDNGKAQLIKYLTQFVNQEIKAAEETLIREARRQYVSNIKEALEAFARKVEEELRELPNEISRDLYLGYKGLIKYMYGPLSSDFTGREESVPQLSSAFRELYEQVQTYLLGEIGREADEQNRKKNPSLPPSEEPYNSKLNEVYDALTKLLTYLKDNDIFDHRLQALLRNLTDALSDLRPESFAKPSTPLLDGLVEGLGVVAFKLLEIAVGRPAEVGVDEGGRVRGVGSVGDGLHQLWALGVIDVAAKQCGQGLGMVLVLVVVGGGSGGAPDALDGLEVGVTKAVPPGAVVMSLGEGGAQ
ncbi:Extracellular matrix-binding ebh, putative [Babesia ovata]|uniref:Extracellular matrix-binding ebh, putative n=1 Tax=Babesia ovata TaxID=189622 RepID=A0A2H6KIJ5_9APIC|nr:Extracellular matrix-binding ebh, putative [Babesia ovata]GBE62799.1 Extracellular matrix-binding ebh, putative [Babesia ovata]